MSSPTTVQALMKAEDLETKGVITPLALSIIKLKDDMRLILGNDAYEALMESESNNVGTFLLHIHKGE